MSQNHNELSSVRKRLLLIVLLVLAGSICIACYVFAKDGGEVHEYQLQQASQALQITGVVKTFQESPNTLTVSKKFGDKTMEVVLLADPETKLINFGVQNRFQDIKAGDKVVVVYLKKDEVNHAKSIRRK